MDVSALPINPLESPTFASAAKSYQGGADTGEKLTDGAVEIDANLLRLRDGAAELLAGLIKLRDGSGELSDGLNDTAVPGPPSWLPVPRSCPSDCSSWMTVRASSPTARRSSPVARAKPLPAGRS